MNFHGFSSLVDMIADPKDPFTKWLDKRHPEWNTVAEGEDCAYLERFGYAVHPDTILEWYECEYRPAQ